jgi:hypothetical protein
MPDDLPPSIQMAFERAMDVLLKHPDISTRPHSAKISLGMNWSKVRRYCELHGLDFDAVCESLVDEYVEKH